MGLFDILEDILTASKFQVVLRIDIDFRIFIKSYASSILRCKFSDITIDNGQLWSTEF